jgi:DnaJ-class molecular chaperone
LSPNSPDHYATLGLDRGCTLAQVRSAYRLLAKRHHPDVNGNTPEAMLRAQELNAAHAVLSDPARRRAYDRELTADEKPPEPVSRIERNVTQDVFLRIDEFLLGTSLEVRVKDPGNPLGSETYALEIPENSAPGTRFRIERGAPFEGGWVVVRAKARPGGRFKVKGSDLRTELRISAQRATSGGSETISGATGRPLRIQVPAGIARGGIVRVAGEGLPKARGGRGDLLVRITYRPEVRIVRTFGR